MGCSVFVYVDNAFQSQSRLRIIQRMLTNGAVQPVQTLLTIFVGDLQKEVQTHITMNTASLLKLIKLCNLY